MRTPASSPALLRALSQLNSRVACIRNHRKSPSIKTMSSASNHLRPARDPDGGGRRGPRVPQQPPRVRARGQRFDMEVLETYSPMHNAYLDELLGLDIAVDTVPRMRLRADMSIVPDDIV